MSRPRPFVVPTGPTLDRRRLLQTGGVLAAVGGGALLSSCTSEGGDDAEATTAGATTSASAVAASGAGAGRRVTFIVHDRNPFFAPVEAGFTDFGQLAGWETQFTGPPQFDVQATVDAQTSALAARPDGVIFTRVDETAFDRTIQQAIDDEIAIVLSNVASAGYQDLGVGFVGQDFVPAGQVCGAQICRFAQDKTSRTDGLIIAGNFSPGNSAIEQRVEGTALGVEEYNEANGTSFTVDVLVTSSDEAEAVAAIDARYRRDSGDIVGWAMAGFDHQFVAVWSETEDLVGSFAVGGFDLTAPVLEGIAADTIDFSLGQNPYAQGWMAACMLWMQMEQGFPANGTYDTGAEIVDAAIIEAVTEREGRFT